MAATKLMERVSSDHTTRVDKSAGVIHDVRILGLESLNGRRYTREAVARARPLYEGRRVFFDHSYAEGRDRPVQDVAGWLQNVRIDADGGLRGDLHLLTADPRARKIMEAAERRPDLFGMSHSARGHTRTEAGQVLVDEIESVDSVDIVSDPATARSLFESHAHCGSHGGRPLATGPQSFRAALCSPAVSSLSEQAGSSMPTDIMPMGPNSDPPAVADVKAKFSEAAKMVFDSEDLSIGQKLRKLERLLKAREDAISTAGDADAAIEQAIGDLADDTAAQMATESIRRQLAHSRLIEAGRGRPAPMPRATEAFARSLKT